MSLAFKGLRDGSFFKRLAIPDKSLAAETSEFEVLRQLDRVDRTGVFTEPAEHATREIVSEGCELLVFGFRVALTANDDQVFRARDRAQIARDAESFAGFRVDVETGRATITLGHVRTFGGILLCIQRAGSLASEGDREASEQVKEWRASNFIPHDDAADGAGCMKA
jgi:hypothetical protein